MGMNSIRTLNLLHSLLLTSVLVFSCKDSNKPAVSPQDPYFQQFISGYSAGVLSSKAGVSILFSQIPAWADLSLDELVSLEPGVKVKVSRPDERQLLIEPLEQWKPGQEYLLTLALDKLFKVEEAGFKKFQFTFQTIKQQLELQRSGLMLLADGSGYELRGSLFFADQVSKAVLDQLLQAKLEDQAIPIKFSGVLAQEKQFVIGPISVSSEATTLELNYSGEAIEAEQKGRIEVRIPANTEFIVLEHQVIQYPNQAIEVYFSKAIDPKQALDGLVTLEGVPGCKMELNANKISIFPPVRQSGTYNLLIHPNLKNNEGSNLKVAYQYPVVFESLKPALRAVGEGVILPSTSNWVVPFEAISLRSVQLTVLKVYESNMGFFLQANELDGKSEFRRVGRPIIRKTIPLASLGAYESGKWTRFSLDMNKLVSQEKGALYQVVLSFDKNDILYSCGESKAASSSETIAQEPFDADAYDVAYDSPYGYDEGYMDYYNDPEYDWQQRENPCNPAYYDWDRLLIRNLLVSNIGLIAKRGTGNELHVYATELSSARPLAGVEIKLLDFQLQLLAQGKTDSEGSVKLLGKRRPFLVLATKDKEKAFLKVEEASALSISTFDVGGVSVQKAMKGFLYGERGVWRPGDTVFVSFMLQSLGNPLPDQHPVKIEWRDPSGIKKYENTTLASVGGLYHFPIPTQTTDATGFYQARVKVGGAVFEKRFQIESIKPNRIHIEFEPGEIWQLSKGPLQIPLKARWYNGGPAAGFKASYELNLTPSKTTFKGYDNYEFDPLGIQPSPQSTTVFEGFLDTKGEAKVIVSLPAENHPFPTYKALFTGKVFEPGGDFSIDAVSLPCRRYSRFAGILKPEAKGWAGMLEAGKSHTVQLAHVNADGSPAQGKLIVNVHKLDWRWWWEDYGENIQYEQLNYQRALLEEEVSTSGGKGSFRLSTKQSDWGRYLVQVKDPVSGHFSSLILYFDWPEGRVNDGSARSGAEYLSLLSDRQLDAPGEQANILFESPMKGMALLTIENGSDILHSRWHEVNEGRNSISYPIESGAAPGIYACISLILPHEAVQSGQPLRRYGYLYLPVEDPSTRLLPQLIYTAEARPGQKLSIKVKEQNSKAMAYTLAIVDEGLLALNRFKTPDPHDAFYAREALGVHSWDLYPYVIGTYSGQFGRLLSIGGDGELPVLQPDPERHLKSWVHVKGPFFLKSGQTAEHFVQIPSFNGEARVMLVAGYQGAFGQVEQKLKVSQPLSMLVSLPRMISEGEEILVPVNVFNQRKEPRSVQMTIKTEGVLQSMSSSAIQLTVGGQGSQLAYVKLKATASGKGYLNLAISSGTDKATERFTLEITDRSPIVSRRIEKQLNEKEEWTLKSDELPLYQIREMQLQASVFQLPNLQGRINDLMRYPHGCLEQTVSTAFPLLYLPGLSSLSTEDEQDRQYFLNTALRKLETFQSSSGELSYWPGASYYHEWSALYAGHFMIEASSKGLSLPGTLLKDWIQTQSRKAGEWKAGKFQSIEVQAYRLMLLSLAGQPAYTAQNQLLEQYKPQGDPTLLLAAAYALSGNEATAQQILREGTGSSSTSIADTWEVLYSVTRSKALRLYNHILLKQTAEAEKLAIELSQAMSSETLYNTHETSWMLMALMNYIDRSHARSNQKCQFELLQNNKPLPVSTSLPSATLGMEPRSPSWKIKNTSGGKLYLQLHYTGKLRSEAAMERLAQGLSLKVNIQFHSDGREVDLSKVKPGDELLVSVTVSNLNQENKTEQIALTLPVPNGYELRNDRLLGQSQGLDHIDLRDQELRCYFNLSSGKSKTISQRITCTHQGKLYWPAIVAESMYSPGIIALEPARWIKPADQIP